MTVLLFLLSFSTIAATNGLASAPSPTEFSYAIKAKQANTRDSKPEYRNTGNTNDKWGVVLLKSNETGGKTFTDFWLERYDETNVSSAISVKEADGVYTNTAYTSASYTSVYLTAENNNYNNETYIAKGKWRPYGY